jgi:hypothetical protein
MAEASHATAADEVGGGGAWQRGGAWGLQLQKQLELVAMVKTVGQEGDRNIAKTRRRSRGKARRSHQEVACVLGEVRGGSEWPDFAGDCTVRRGPCRRF